MGSFSTLEGTKLDPLGNPMLHMVASKMEIDLLRSPAGGPPFSGWLGTKE